MPPPRITRSPVANAPANGPVLRPHVDITLPLARAHEACGPARISFALWIAEQMSGHILWITQGKDSEILNSDGISRWIHPGHILFIKPQGKDDPLWCMEEALRSGAVALVIADLPAPPDLTPIRRLHLAAETGANRGTAPLALVLTPGDGGAPGVESRWHMTPDHAGEVHRWNLERRRARTYPPKAWKLIRKRGGWALKPAKIQANVTRMGKVRFEYLSQEEAKTPHSPERINVNGA